MKIGINWSSHRTLPIIHELYHQGIIEFCEIIVDNFAHLPAENIRQALSSIPVSLHFVASRFLEKSPAELSQLAEVLRPWIKALQPIYVSDHLVRFTETNGKRHQLITELDYENVYDEVKDRIVTWQNLLDTQLYFENHASLTKAGQYQAAFYAKLRRDTEAGLLFDFSNAYIAEQNHVCTMQTWDALITTTTHFHVGGFRWDATSQLALDTHDAPIANAVIDIIKKYQCHLKDDTTLVIEFDKKREVTSWKKDIQPLLC